MKVASWNVNSLRARLGRVLDWLAREKPDVLCLQEIKAQEQDFPATEIRAAGYHTAVYGQKSYNGVAVLAREPLEDVALGFQGGPADPQARLVAATVTGVRVMSAYIPNGATVTDPKYSYKRAWLARLQTELRTRRSPGTPLLLCGDFNIVHRAIDAATPARWEGSVLFNPEMCAWMDELLASGFVDTYRRQHPETRAYSWWDYRRLSFPNNDGLRIDYVLATDELAARCRAAWMDRDERKGSKPSDHVPVVAEFDDWPSGRE